MARYTPEIADEICRRLSEGESLRAICRDEAMPGRRTILEWLERDEDGFRARYARARDAQADDYAERQLEVASDTKREPHCRRTECEALRWYAEKLRPDRYGSRTVLAGDSAAPLTAKVTVEFVDAPKGKE